MKQGPNFNLNNYTIEQLVEIKNNINNHIDSYVDGYVYICKVRSYGRNWSENITNTITLQELCNRYSGDDGIVDVYSTNPDLSHIENYGDVKYIRSKDDYKKWSDYEFLKRIIPDIEKEWEEWDNRENIPFHHRPHFSPIYSKEHLEDMKNELLNYDMSFEEPKSYKNEKAIIKFNSGNLALLCSGCRVIIKTGVDFNEEESKFAKGEIDYLDPLYCETCKNNLNN